MRTVLTRAGPSAANLRLPLVVLGIMLLAWHPVELEPLPGLDQSWQAALHMALHDRIPFGSRFIFTYGPLGFLGAPTLWFGTTGAIAVVYTLLLRLSLAWALFVGARRSHGTVIGAVVALVVACASEVSLEPVPFLVLGVWLIDRELPTRRRLELMALSGGLCGLQLLNKESIGLEVTAMAVVVALAAGRRRDNLIVMTSALGLVLLTAWIVAGQSLSDLPDYAASTVQAVSGYAAAMGLEQAGTGIALQYPAGAVAVAFGVGAVIHMTTSREAGVRRGMLALWAVFCFFEYKEGFVRHDGGHAAEFFIALTGGFLAFSWRSSRRVVALGMTAILIGFTVAANRAAGHSSFSDFNLAGNVESSLTQVYQAASRSERVALEAAGRKAIRNAYPLDAESLALLRGRTVHAWPDQTAVVWAYNLRWSPFPVFQSYLAYTTKLDEDDANALTSTHAPERILRSHEPYLDGRYQPFDEGLTTRTVLCRYRQLRVTPALDVLGRVPNRCAPPIALGTARAGWNQEVPVPKPPNAHSLVFVRVYGVSVGGLERVIGLLYKPAERSVRLNGARYRLVPGTAADGLLLSAPTSTDLSSPYRLAPDSSNIAISRSGQGATRSGPLRYVFFSQSIAPAPGSPTKD